MRPVNSTTVAFLTYEGRETFIRAEELLMHDQEVRVYIHLPEGKEHDAFHCETMMEHVDPTGERWVVSTIDPEKADMMTYAWALANLQSRLAKLERKGRSYD